MIGINCVNRPFLIIYGLLFKNYILLEMLLRMIYISEQLIMAMERKAGGDYEYII